MQANEVVAVHAALPNVLQLPSPVYGLVWIDETHILVAGGGGGRRFGMANVLVLLEVAKAESPDCTTGVPAETSGRGTSGATMPAVPWRFVAALDLEGDVPWCTSQFCAHTHSRSSSAAADDDDSGKSPRSNERAASAVAAADTASTATRLRWCAGQQAALRNLYGYVALSSVACFVLVGVYRQNNARDGDDTYTLRRLSRVALPCDARNADKKPIALVADAASVVVAHDEGGVHVYRLDALIPCAHAHDADGSGSNEEDVDGNDNGHNGDTIATASRRHHHHRGTRSCTNVSNEGDNDDDDAAHSPRPYAVWRMGARVNDLHACCTALAHAKLVTTRTAQLTAPAAASSLTATTPSRKCRALLLRYLVVAVALHDKTLRIGCVRLPHHHSYERQQPQQCHDCPCAAPSMAGGRTECSGSDHGSATACGGDAQCEDKRDTATGRQPIGDSDTTATARLLTRKTRPSDDAVGGTRRLSSGGSSGSNARGGSWEHAHCTRRHRSPPQPPPPHLRRQGHASSTLSFVAGPVLTGSACGLSFALMPSSLRLVRLYAHDTRACRALVLHNLRQQGLLPLAGDEARGSEAADETVGASTPWASLLLIAYDVTSSQSYAVCATLGATLGSDATHAADAEGSTVSSHTHKRRVGQPSALLYDTPTMHLSVSASPSLLLADCVTSIAACVAPAHVCANATTRLAGTWHEPVTPQRRLCEPTRLRHEKEEEEEEEAKPTRPDAAASSSPPPPPPPEWCLVGTVEGCVALLRRGRGEHGAWGYRVYAQRPSTATTTALHKEPISAVAASPRGVVATADIAQHVVLTALTTASATRLPLLFGEPVVRSSLCSWLTSRFVPVALIVALAVAVFAVCVSLYAH